MERKDKSLLKLPIEVTGRSEVNILLRELQSIDDYLLTAEAKKSATGSGGLKLTRVLSVVAKDNGYNLLDQNNRKELRGKLNTLIKKSPQLHLSFAADPSPQAVERILLWLRANIHPTALIQIGLQPNIVAGMVLRTPNQIFDMSMREYMSKQTDTLMKLVEQATKR